MPSIRDRSENNKTRKGRLANVKRGPGVFRFLGGIDVAYVPTYLLHGRKEAVFSANGLPVVDSSGRQVYERSGSIVRDERGQPVLGGEPKRVETPITEIELRGLRFVEGEPVEVTDATLALKLRGMNSFEEIEPGEVIGEPKRKRGRPRKAKPEGESVDAEEPAGEES
jgi:hypothetical protein